MKEIYCYGKKYKDTIKKQLDKLLNQKKQISAKEMFEKLGYEQVTNNFEEIAYQKAKYFNKYSKTISMYIHINFEIDTKRVFSTDYLTLDEMQAINKQIEELGWNK